MCMWHLEYVLIIDYPNLFNQQLLVGDAHVSSGINTQANPLVTLLYTASICLFVCVCIRISIVNL